MSFAAKIKAWGFATSATNATNGGETPEKERGVANVAIVASPAPLKSEAQERQSVANVADVASPLTFFPKSEPPHARDRQMVESLVRHGLSVGEANALAAKLELRKAEMDDRRICMECRYLVGGRMCTNALRAGLSVSKAKTAVAQGQHIQLQRCPGFGQTMH